MTTPTPNPSSTYPGFKVQLMGPTGSGKTHSLATLSLLPLEVFIIFLDPGQTTLVKACTDPPPGGLGLKEIPRNVHWASIKMSAQNFGKLQQTAVNLGRLDLSGLAKLADLQRGINNPLEKIYGLLNDFVDDRTGEHYGPVTEWGTDRVLCIDNTSSLVRGIWQAVTGNAPMADKPHYALVQGQLKNVVLGLTEGCQTNFVLLSHPEREVDSVMGGVKLYPSIPGKALSATFNQPFDDVILCVRESDKFYWDTMDSQADLKTRHLPIAHKLPPDFKTIHQVWLARKNLAEGK